MDTERIYLDRNEAQRLYQSYLTHKHYQDPIDWEVQRAYQLLAKGKLIIKALESIAKGSFNEAGLPKLALARATAKVCHLRRHRNGSMIMTGGFKKNDSWRTREAKGNKFDWRADTFSFDPNSFPMDWQGKSRTWFDDHEAQVPLIPIHLRPKRGLASYHILWEAEWEPVPPVDPFLLRRIGKADLWLVVAEWNLTPVERAALATRI